MDANSDKKEGRRDEFIRCDLENQAMHETSLEETLVIAGG